jgi:ComF family protein
MFLTEAAHLVSDALLTLAYPQACKLCGISVEKRSFGIVCETCWRVTPIFTGHETICWKCGVVSAGDIQKAEREQVRCRRCDSHPYVAARAVGLYEGGLRESILLLKRQPYLSRHLAELLSQACRRHPINFITRVIPVPLHPKRIRLRGFNQASVIARVISKSLEVPLDEVSLLRVSASEKYRAGLDAKGRHETVAKAFAVRYPRLIAGEDILLVDDVFTTGATVSSCTEVLLAAGASSVFVLTLARPAY